MITYDQAKKYIDAGFSIFPVILSWNGQKFEKRPAVKWQDYQTRRATDTELHLWFDTPQYNGLGLATGQLSGVVVVDVEAIAEDKDREKLQSKLVSRTISGGWHYYYRWTKELRNAAKIEGRPIDFRGDGGFVVIPPSECNGKAYTWESKAKAENLDPLPEKLEDSLTQPEPSLSLRSDNSPYRQAQVGERNMTAAQLAGHIAVKLPREFWDYGLQILKDWNAGNPEPLPERELETTWNSIKNTDLRNHPLRVEGEEAKVMTGKQAVEEFQRLSDQYGDGITTGFSELDHYFTFLPEQLYLVSAATHTGKTMFALNMAARIASFGRKVLFASLEQGVFITQFVERIIGGDHPDNLWLLTSDKMLSIRGLIEAVRGLEQKPDLLIVDHLHFLKKSGRGATEDLDQNILELQNAAKTLQLPILAIAHVRKLNSDRAPEMDDLRDSSSLSQVPSVVMFLYRHKAEECEDSYLASNGVLFIPKNRIQGRTGAIKYDLRPTGEMVFKKKGVDAYEAAKKIFNS